MKLAIFGALGRMGQLIGSLAEEYGYEIVCAVEHKSNPNIGKNYFSFINKPGELAVTTEISVDAEVALDFTLPVALDNVIEQCTSKNVPLVTGTTGLSAKQVDKLRKAGEKIPVMYGSNFSLGVAVVRNLVEQAAKILYPAGFDIEIVEAHHRKKVDAPSGTAIAIGESAAKGAGLTLAEHGVFTRFGETGARKKEEIGFSVVRGGTIPGEHTVMFAGENEIVEISHRAQDRQIFVRGALSAAKWFVKQDKGFYTIDDFLQSIL